MRKAWSGRLAMVALWGMLGAGTAGAQSWVVGQVAPLTGAHATQGRAYEQGMRLYFDSVNKGGGIQGRSIRFVALDDRGDPEETVAQTRKLIEEHKPAVLAGFFGNRNLAQLVDSQVLQKAAQPVVGYRSDDEKVLHSPLFFQTRASVREEMHKIATHLATVGITRLALVLEERPDSASMQALVTEAIQPAGAKLVAAAEVSGGSGTKQFKPKATELAKLMQASPQAILVVASSAATAAFVEHYRMEGGGAQIYTSSDTEVEQLAKRLGSQHLAGLSIAQVVPSPYKISMPLNKEFRDALIASKAQGQPVSYAMMEGFVNAKVVAEVLRRAPGASPEKLAQALQAAGPMDLGGYSVAFRPGSSVGSRYVDLSIVSASGRVSQ